MINTFKQNIHVEKFLEDAARFEIKEKSDYLSYREFIKYFSDIQTITQHNLTIGINFTYGWMPTIFNFRSANFNEALEILNQAKGKKALTTQNLELLKSLFNNSLVGTTKLLHFINPNQFAIWDSRVYYYLTGNKAHQYRIGNCTAYLDYLEFCEYLTQQTAFKQVQEIVENQVGYPMTPLRVAELVMYHHGMQKR